MAETVFDRTVVNPGRKARGRRSRTSQPRRRTTRRAARRRNSGEHIIGYTWGVAGHRRNPAKKGSTMAQTKKARRRRAAGSRKHSKGKARRHNVGIMHHRRRRHNAGMMAQRRRRHNPGMFTGVGGLVSNAVFVIAGAVGSKVLTQAVLGSNNTGWMGYGGNAIAGVALWFVVDKVMRNRVAAHNVLIGSIVQIVLRIINDMTPFGQYFSQLGMGDYQAQSFVTPQVLVDPFNSARIKIPAGWAPAALPAPAQSPTSAAAKVGVSGYGGGGLYHGRSRLY